ncbi:MAG: Sec-independent protein translocase protein TatB [Candidatus Puniceispirillales bacterium]
MLDFGWQEIIVVAFVLVLVVGPKDMPRALKGFTNFVGKMRGMANEFRNSMLEVADQEEFRDVKNALNETKAGLIEQTKDPINAIKKDMDDVADDINLTETVSTVKESASAMTKEIKSPPQELTDSSKASQPKSNNKKTKSKPKSTTSSS